jgi:oligo-1,6-glucosidase
MHQSWWKDSVVYQIYPRSFCDGTNDGGRQGDGIGDLRGIIQRLDYLQQLGVDVVWLSPVYKSPNDDNGYDISDYRDIMTEFGTLADWREMIAGMHQRGIKLVMDLVVNHTSDEHPWFVEARKSRDNPFRDYYIWREPKDGGEPNNWASFFSGSAWQFDEATGEYYLHLFTKKQPDLNWENPRVRAEVYDLMHWWLKQGVDGFRMDVINMISKAPGLPDAPVVNAADRYQFGGQYFINGPRLLEFLHEMKREVLSKYDLMTVGETPLMTPDYASLITHPETGYLSMLFEFDHVDLDTAPNSAKWFVQPWRLCDLKEVTTRWQTGLENKGWNSLFLTNHDQPRAVSRFGDDGEYRVQSAKLLATFTHLLQGTPYIYQGEEIGMTNVAFESIEDYRDVESLNMYREFVQDRGLDPQVVLGMLHAKSRDNARTPVQWSAAANAGFTTGTPWSKVNPNYTTINAEQALADPDSIFYYYQRLIQLRKSNPVIVHGTYDLVLADHPQIYAFTRTWQTDRLLVILNFSRETPPLDLPTDLIEADYEVMIANYPIERGHPHRSILRPYEARVYRVQ